MAGELAKQTGASVTGFYGKSDYSNINNHGGEGYSSWSNWKHGFQTGGSPNLPVGGQLDDDSADSKKYIFKTPKSK